jgi:cytochrome P450
VPVCLATELLKSQSASAAGGAPLRGTLTPTEVLGNLFDLLGPGIFGVAYIVTTSIRYLARSAAVQREARDAAVELLAAARPSQSSLMDALASCTAVQDILHEVFRLDAIQLEYHRRALIAGELELSDGRRVQYGAGTHFMIDMCTMQRDPAVWGPDADLFRPSRWRNLTHDQRSSYMPFGAGYTHLLIPLLTRSDAVDVPGHGFAWPCGFPTSCQR